MPEPGENEKHDEFIERCIPIVIDDGTAKDGDQAVAVCNSIWDDKHKSAKIGRRNSASDLRRIQDAHELLADLGATCSEKSEVTVTPMLSLSVEDTVINYGGEVKALGDGKLGGYLVTFSDESSLDLTGEYFAKDTDYGDATTSPVLYHHGMDDTLKLRTIGRGELRKDDIGVWIEAQLELRDEYEKAIYGMAEKNKLGWSSGSASHLILREGSKITRWPLGLDASLTPTPAEPRNGAIPLKSLLPGVNREAVAVEGGESNQTITESRGDTMEFTQEELSKLVTEAIAEYKKAEEPATVKTVPNVEVTKDEADQPFKTAGDFFMA